MNEFFAMGGYAIYVWSCFGITAIVLFLNLFLARKRHLKVLKKLKLMNSGG